MAAQAGKSFLLKIGTAVSGTTIAAMRVTRFAASGEMIDVTNKDSANLVRELLAGGGIKSLQVTAEGVLTGSAQATTLLGYVMDGSLNAFGLIFDNGDAIDASFQMTAFEAGGEYNGVQTYSLTLQSSGAVTVTAAA